jgi:hypothetical protein
MITRMISLIHLYTAKACKYTLHAVVENSASPVYLEQRRWQIPKQDVKNFCFNDRVNKNRVVTLLADTARAALKGRVLRFLLVTLNY